MESPSSTTDHAFLNSGFSKILTMFPSPFIIFPMCEHVPHENFPSIKVHHSNEAIFVPSDIKDNPVSYLVSRWKCGLQFTPRSKSGPLYRSKPRFQRLLAIRVFHPELFERLLGNNVHYKYISI